jgi:hypothetical protein
MTSSAISAYQREKQEITMSNLNFTTEDGNDGTMYPETIPPILLHASLTNRSWGVKIR